MNRKDSIEKLKNILESYDFRFANYQEIPQFVFDQIPCIRLIKYKKKQVDIDYKRYVWLKKNLSKKVKKVCEIGSNIGYFSSSLAKDYSFFVQAYEPNNLYAKVSKIISNLTKLDNRLKIYNEGINLHNIKKLDSHDLTINLNVLHHAGCSYDVALFKDNMKWEDYVISYLKKLSTKSNYLFFQTGNMMKGKAIFPSIKVIDIFKNIFDKSGWKINNIGVINNLDTLDYVNYLEKDIPKIKLYNCKRDKMNNKVAYYYDKKYVSHLTTGLAQRPLWFCQKVNKR